MYQPSPTDTAYKAFVNSRRAGMLTTRWSWWCHWRELALYFLPRRYRWFVTANQMNRGSPINQNILDSTGVLAARNLASGLMSGKISPSQQWLSLAVDTEDATGTTATSLWLADCERRMRRVFSESNFYTSVAQWLYDLVIFGTASIIIYDNYDSVINCVNPCAGEYYVDVDACQRPTILYRDFTLTVAAIIDEFDVDACPLAIQQAYHEGGSRLTQEYIICHAIEPNDDGKAFCSSRFDFREAYWVEGSTTGQQAGTPPEQGFLRKKGFHEQPHATVRWDIVSNDPYGRSPAMDALPDEKQLMHETKRKAQAIDKGLNPPMIADAILDNKPATMLPGGITYIPGMMNGSKPGMESIYKSQFDISHVTEDLEEVRDRLKKTFFVDLFQPISQFETRSNVTAVEINQRKSESLIMLGPVFERLDNEGLRPIVERVWGIMSRAGCFKPPPQEIAGKDVQVRFVSMLALAQDAANSASIQQVFGLAGSIAGIDPTVMDKINVDVSIDIFSKLLNNDPRMMRTDAETQAIRQNRAQQQQEVQRADNAQKLAMSAKNLAQAPLGQGSALDAVSGGGGL